VKICWPYQLHVVSGPITAPALHVNRRSLRLSGLRLLGKRIYAGTVGPAAPPAAGAWIIFESDDRPAATDQVRKRSFASDAIRCGSRWRRSVWRSPTAGPSAASVFGCGAAATRRRALSPPACSRPMRGWGAMSPWSTQLALLPVGGQLKPTAACPCACCVQDRGALHTARARGPPGAYPTASLAATVDRAETGSRNPGHRRRLARGRCSPGRPDRNRRQLMRALERACASGAWPSPRARGVE